MRKKTLIFIILGAITIVVVLFVLSLALNRNETGTGFITPTPSEGLSVVSSSIKDGQINVPLGSQIIIKFNSKISSSTISFSMLPTPTYDFEVKDDSLIITPTLPLQPSTLYSISVSNTATNDLITSFSFTTLGPTPTLLPDTRPSGEPENTDALLIQTRPDVYLSNKLPYSSKSFSASYEYKTAPSGHFAFSVTLSGDTNIARSEFLTWLSSLGLADEQINSLDITYN